MHHIQTRTEYFFPPLKILTPAPTGQAWGVGCSRRAAIYSASKAFRRFADWHHRTSFFAGFRLAPSKRDLRNAYHRSASRGVAREIRQDVGMQSRRVAHEICNRCGISPAFLAPHSSSSGGRSARAFVLGEQAGCQDSNLGAWPPQRGTAILLPVRGGVDVAGELPRALDPFPGARIAGDAVGLGGCSSFLPS